MSREQIRQAALALDPDERVALAVELFESLEPEARAVEEAWEAEIDRRVEEVERGTATGSMAHRAPKHAAGTASNLPVQGYI